MHYNPGLTGLGIEPWSCCNLECILWHRATRTGQGQFLKCWLVVMTVLLIASSIFVELFGCLFCFLCLFFYITYSVPWF